MVEVHQFTRLRKWLSLNRLAILDTHYRALKEQAAPAGALEKEEFAFFTAEFERYHRKAERLAFYRVMFYVFLYATFAVSLLKLIPLLRFLVPFIELGGAFVGGGIAFIAIFLLSVKINMHIQRMEACMTHMVVFYHKNRKRDSRTALAQMSRVI